MYRICLLKLEKVEKSTLTRLISIYIIVSLRKSFLIETLRRKQEQKIVVNIFIVFLSTCFIIAHYVVQNLMLFCI